MSRSASEQRERTMKDLDKVLQDAGVHICPICGTPYEPYHSRQRTCGSDKCRREWKKAYLHEWTQKRKEKDPEAWKEYRRKAARKHYLKKRSLERFANELADLRRYAHHQEEFDKFVSEHGHEYGKYSAEKVLATVPKIDTNLEKK